MPTSIPEASCLHCNTILTPKDIADGWCDSCGKRVPLSLGIGSKSKTTAAPVPVDVDIPDSHRSPRWAWAVAAAMVLGFAALFFFARGG